MAGLRRMAATIFRKTYRGELDVDAGSKMMQMVRVMAEMTRDMELERRIGELEERAAPQRVAGLPKRWPRAVN
jgi:hypothetical protein